MAAGTPWWYLTRTTRHGWVVGGFMTCLGASSVVTDAITGGSVIDLVVHTGMLVLGITYLTSAAARHRRESGQVND